MLGAETNPISVREMENRERERRLADIILSVLNDMHDGATYCGGARDDYRIDGSFNLDELAGRIIAETDALKTQAGTQHGH